MKLRLPPLRTAAALVSVALSAIFLSCSLGLFPDRHAAVLEGRKCLCESLAVYSSIAAQNEDWPSIRSGIFQVGERNPDILSIGIRRPDGTLAVAWKEHAETWCERVVGGTSTETRMQVPILKDNDPWGSVEVAFPAVEPPLFPWPKNSFSGFLAFAACVCLFAFYAYLCRVMPRSDAGKNQPVVPQRVRAAMDSLAEGVLILDNDRRIALANEAFSNLVGIPPKDLQGMPADQLPWIADPRERSQTLPWEHSLSEGAPQVGVIVGLQNGLAPVQSLSVNATPIVGDDGSHRGAMATFDNLTPLERKNTSLGRVLRRLRQSRNKVRLKNEELRNLALRDPLTGAFNRRSLFAELEHLWESRIPFSVVMVDIDHFKSINDRFGHSVGDQVLQQVVRVLRETTRDLGIVCRYGGEEFCILFPHVDLMLATSAAETLRQSIAADRLADVAVTASFGVSSRDLGADTAQGIVDQADKALYASKRSGRNRVTTWSDVPEHLLVESPAEKQQPASARETERSIGEAGVEALFALLETVCPETARHSRRVADLCGDIAKGLLPSREIRVLKMAALLHDVGKVAPQGAVDSAESATATSISRVSENILRDAFDSDLLARIVRNAHAWFAGSPTQPEMPHGLAIPIASRVLAVADAFETISTGHGHRHGVGPEKAAADLLRKAGTRYDPTVVGKLATVLEKRELATVQATPLPPEEKTQPPRVASAETVS